MENHIDVDAKKKQIKNLLVSHIAVLILNKINKNTEVKQFEEVSRGVADKTIQQKLF